MKTSLLDRYLAIRAQTKRITAPLTAEDQMIQSMEDTSPTKWHLAHTTWFFETFALKTFLTGYQPLNDTYGYLFNSYYVQAGARFMRDRRGLISRPSVQEVWDYRNYVDEHMVKLLKQSPSQKLTDILEIGINHEQQHQELMVTDIQHALFANPLAPSYFDEPRPQSHPTPDMDWITFDEGIVHIGHTQPGFAYDNEGPSHRQYLENFALGNRPISNQEVLDFIGDGGYSNPLVWLSSGWAIRELEEWHHPLYWDHKGDEWTEFTLFGKGPVDPNAPATHLSYYEADAIARWMGVRLPTEFEWEHAAGTSQLGAGHFSDEFSFYPHFTDKSLDVPLIHMLGSSWEWTNSHYSPYPGYKPVDGALGEYNGKFMANQFVLRGGSCATPANHIRLTYRNFFPAHARWQYATFRPAKRL